MPTAFAAPPACHAPLIIDIAGTALTDIDRQRLAHPLVGGMILFGRNWHDRAQLTALCAQIKALRPDLLICVDHEGGRVQRFRTDGFTHLPAMGVLGQLWTQASPERARQAALACGYVLAAELRACGVDLSFTPVLDLDWGTSSIIGDRSFGRDPATVTSLAQSLMHGLLQAGMANCGKHFPGHGFAAADSHVAMRWMNAALRPSWPTMLPPIPGWRRCSPASCLRTLFTPRWTAAPLALAPAGCKTSCAASLALTA